MPSPSFSQAIALGTELLRGRRRVKAARFTTESVQETLESGEVVVRNRTLPVTGEVRGRIRPGDDVVVAWDARDQPRVIVKHQARRAQPALPPPLIGGGVVEELFTNDFGALLEVWLRDETRFEPIEFVAAGEEAEPADDPSSLGFTGGVARWGKGSADFFTFDGDLSGGARGVAVYRLSRPTANEPFEEAEPVRAVLVRLYNLTTDPFAFGTIAVSASSLDLTQTGVATGPLKYVATYSKAEGAGPDEAPWPIQIEAVTRVAGVAPNGELLVVVEVGARAPLGQVGETDAVFSPGSILVNVPRALVLANHLAASLGATIHGSPQPTPFCTALGTTLVTVSMGAGAAQAGAITVLSLTGANPAQPDDPAQPGTFNNYLLMHPAFVNVEPVRVEDPPGNVLGFHACSPARSPVKLSIIGEYEALNAEFAEFPGSALGASVSQAPRLQGSRTMLVWAPYTSLGVALDGALEIRDLESGLTRPVAGDPDRIFGSETFPPWGNFPVNDLTIRPLVLLQASTIYSPRGEAAPFDEQFFHAFSRTAENGIEGLDVDVPVEDSNLEEQAALLGVEAEDTARLELLDSGSGDVQALNSERLADRQSESVVL